MRILIATVTAGAGHLQAAAALEEAWRGLRPADVVEKVDLLDFVSRLQRKVYVQGYMKLVEHAESAQQARKVELDCTKSRARGCSVIFAGGVVEYDKP